jgi:hypothetical protein
MAVNPPTKKAAGTSGGLVLWDLEFQTSWNSSIRDLGLPVPESNAYRFQIDNGNRLPCWFRNLQFPANLAR